MEVKTNETYRGEEIRERERECLPSLLIQKWIQNTMYLTLKNPLAAAGYIHAKNTFPIACGCSVSTKQIFQ
jgi:hypothetical protein